MKKLASVFLTSDYNRDGKRDINDVTGLQKHLAGFTDKSAAICRRD